MRAFEFRNNPRENIFKHNCDHIVEKVAVGEPG